jgi:uncharacterized membrane protein
MELKIKHLEFIQATINRMAGNSFLMKGWAITIIGGLLAVSIKELNALYVYISFAVLFFFWLLDSFYLSHERMYIKLYDEVRKKSESTIDFSMSTKHVKGRCEWRKCAFSKTMWLFYGGLAVVGLILIIKL